MENLSREKQIEEMARVLCEDCARDVAPCSLNKSGRMCDSVREQAEALYNAGYRKQSENTVEVVRCKDCRHSALTSIDGVLYCFKAHNKVGCEDYCSCGEKKGGAE